MNNKKPHISIVSPVYRAEKIVAELVREIVKNVSPLTENFEIILVEDHSPDHSWEAIQAECLKDSRVKGIKFTRNFGQDCAVSAGVLNTDGDWIIIMDCDLQDRPEEIPNLYKAAQQSDAQVIYARRSNRKDSFLKKLSSKIFYKTYNYISRLELDGDVSNFGIYSRTVIDSYKNLKPTGHSFTSAINYFGYKTNFLTVQHGSRAEGKTSYNFKKLMMLSLNILVSNTNRPLLLCAEFGFLLASLSILLAVYNLIAYFVQGNILAGFTTTIFSIWFVGGMMMFVTGISGVYIGKIFDDVKERPQFVVEQKVNF